MAKITDDELVAQADKEEPDPHIDPVIASVSGGKDSTAMSLWLIEQGIEHRRVFADTGWEHEATVEYVHEYLPTVLGPIDVAPAKYSMEQLIKKKGMFPTRMRRWCTEQLKTLPIKRYMNAIDPDRKAINAVGLRAQESLARAILDVWEWDAQHMKRWVWRPILKWSEEDVIAIHKRHDVKPNPLYLMGARRVGCWPCIFARKSEIRLIADKDPKRIERIKRLEGEVAELAKERYAAKGETPDSLGYNPPTFFHIRTADSKARNGMMPIEDVVGWSQTARGGRQFELFYEEAQDGCMRWGLCDSVGDLDDEAEA